MSWDTFSAAQGIIALGIILSLGNLSSTFVFYNVTCGSESMMVTLNVSNHPTSLVYLQNLKGYPGCEPQIHPGLVIFQLSLNDTTHCGIVKMFNKETGNIIYYHRIVIEVPDKSKDVIFVQCIIPGDFNMDFVRLDWKRESVHVNYSWLPDLKTFSWWNDTIPYVNMAVRENGRRLDTSVFIQPGSLLDLLIYLEPEVTDRYGLSLRYLTLTDDTRSQEEVIVMNGCSVDPYVIQVFRPANGVLKSQFRAFKLQRSDFVIFLATVNVCLKRCVEVDCYGGSDKNGRRKREIPRLLPHYSNELYEVEISTVLRLRTVDGDIIVEESTNDTLDSEYDEDSYVESVSSASFVSFHDAWAWFAITLGLFLS